MADNTLETHGKVCEVCGGPIYRIRTQRLKPHMERKYCGRECNKVGQHRARSSTPEAVQKAFAAYERDEKGCWIYPGSTKPYGYGSMTFQGEQMKAHRVSYLVFKGAIPSRIHVMHSCDNRACVNPDHLSLGTTYDNNADRVRKGRSAKGEKAAGAKLTEADVRAILKIGDTQSLAATGRQFNVSPHHVRGILDRRFWKHVDFLSDFHAERAKPQ